MKRFSLLIMICVVVVSLVCSAAFGILRMNTESFANLCKTASTSDVRNALNSGAEWDEEAWFGAASSNPDAGVIKLLYNEAKKQGVNVLEWKRPAGDTALRIAAMYNPNPAVVKCLIDLGADVHARDNARSGPVRAARAAHVIGRVPNRNEVVRILLEAGADDETAY